MPALLTDTVAYANQVLRSKKVEDLNSRRTNPAGRPVEDQIALARQKAVETQVQSDPTRFLPTQKDLLRQPGVEDVIPSSTTANQLGDSSVMILSARGTFYLVKLATTYGPGIYAIDELTRTVVAPDTQGPGINFGGVRPGETNSPILLTSIEFNQVDITSQVPCLNNVKVFYSFGQNFGQVAISGEVLLGPLGNVSYDGVNRLVDFFWKYRVSVYKKPIAISVANNSYFVYLTGLRINQVNADFHILPFVMFGTLLDIEREKANAVNTTGVVITEGSLEEPSLFAALTANLPDATRDKQVSKVGEVVTPISTDNDPWLNSILTVPGLELAGPSGNETAATIQQKLNSGPTTQLDRDMVALRTQLKNPNLSTERRIELMQALKGAQIKRAQERNLMADKQVQVVNGQVNIDAVNAYDKALSNGDLPTRPESPSEVRKLRDAKPVTEWDVLTGKEGTSPGKNNPYTGPFWAVPTS